MDIISYYYYQELAKDLNMTQTARKLFISQQTLSNRIKGLEDYYGTLLFHRKPNLSLTSAGEHVLAFAQMIIKEETNLKDIISDIKADEMGILCFGASTVRGLMCLTKIIPKFNERYPNVEIRYTDSLSIKLEALVEDGDLDFAVVLKKDVNNKLVQHHILKDQIYLCVPDTLLKEYYGDEAEAIKSRSLDGAYVKDFARLPFSMFSNRLGKAIHTCFETAGCTPKVKFTTSFSQLLVPLCAQGISACFITQMNLSGVIDQFADKKINIFPLYFEDKPMIQDLSLIYHKERYLPHYARHFLDILFNYFEDLEKVQLARIC